MGTYITEQDVRFRYPIMGTGSLSVVNSDSVYYAEKEVEMALSPVYSIPFAAAHPTIKDLCIDAVYVRWMRMTNLKDGPKINEMFQNRLQRIVDGKDPIITGSGSLEGSASGGDLPFSTTEDYHSIHSLLDAEDNFIDSDYIDELESDRIDD